MISVYYEDSFLLVKRDYGSIVEKEGGRGRKSSRRRGKTFATKTIHYSGPTWGETVYKSFDPSDRSNLTDGPEPTRVDHRVKGSPALFFGSFS